MASAKELKKKIRSISNTKKITRTMELVATAKSKRMQDRVTATTPYAAALSGLLEDLARAETVDHPLLRAPAPGRPVLVFVITANRGLCGGYNTNVVHLAERTMAEERERGETVEVYMAGRKGISRFRFLQIPIAQRFLDLDDKTTFARAAEVAEAIMKRFVAGEVGKVIAVSTRWHTSAVQRPAVTQVLPIARPAPPAGKAAARAAAEGEKVEYLFEPDPRTILEALLPLSVKTELYRLVVEASASEQVARRLAMKLATDNAEEMINFYNRFYNRTRQAGITQQINEIVSGANALE